ncbi:MAG: Uma2 family endonuclease [Gemmatimonadota bacterium]
METEGTYIPGVTHVVTADELERMYVPGKKVELVRGVLVVQELPSLRHSLVAGALYRSLAEFVEAGELGLVTPQDCGFKIQTEPDTVRGPDAAFVARERLDAIPTRGYLSLAPDLVAEVVSPGDSRGVVIEKIGQWLRAGARLAWVIDPERRQAQVYRADGGVSVLNPGDALDGEDVLPGFSLALDALLAAGTP